MHILSLIPRPRVVALHERRALGNRRMIVEPEFDQWIRIRLRKIGLPQGLQSFGPRLRRWRNDAEGHLEAIDVGLALEVPAQAVGYRLRQKTAGAGKQN